MRTPTSIYRLHTGLVYAIADPVNRIDQDESAGPELAQVVSNLLPRSKMPIEQRNPGWALALSCTPSAREITCPVRGVPCHGHLEAVNR
jgi:hypothetical protein